MSRVTIDTRALEKWADDIRNLVENDLDSFFRETLRELADEFLTRVIEKTPKGNYPAKIEFTTRDGKKVSFDNPLAGKSGGDLSKAWRSGEIKKTANGYEIEIYNNATTDKGESYAAHVEYGHRIMNKKGGEVKGFQPGVFMMTATEKELEALAPEVLTRRMETLLRGVFG